MTEVVLGLGSSLGNRPDNLRRALAVIRDIPGCVVRQVSPVYQSDALLPDNAPPEWDVPYLNLALRCEVSLPPEALLTQLKIAEKKTGRLPEKKWGPRIIDIDLLAYGSHIQYDSTLHIPHEHLHTRPFAFWPLADVAPTWRWPVPGPLQGRTAGELVEIWGSRFSGEAPFHTRQIALRIDTPELVGILNVTQDSFSDGGQFNRPESLLQQAEQLVAAGATVLDIGAEATNPSATPLTPDEEWQRLQTVLPALLQARSQFQITPLISVDTRHPSTAKKALAMDVDWINDVSGLDDPEMRKLLVAGHARVVIMHHLGIPARKDCVLPLSQDPVEAVLDWGRNRIQQALDEGIAPEKMIFDPGIGFGKNATQSLLLLQHIGRFRELGIPLLVGHSRKSFFGLLSPAAAKDLDPETAALSWHLMKPPVRYLRVHNVAFHSRQWHIHSAFPTTETV